MNVVEILTIYLTIGAPFGTRYFLTRRTGAFNFFIAVKTVGVVFFWIFYAGWMLGQKSSFVQIKTFASKPFSIEKKIKTVCANLEADFLVIKESIETIAFFDFRELLERYIGLTSAVQHNAPDSPIFPHEIEIFRIANQKKTNLQLAARILHRNNYRQLQVHQIHAQQNLLRIVDELMVKLEFDENTKLPTLLKARQFARNLANLADLLQDFELDRALQKIVMRQQEHKVLVKNDEQVETNKWILQQPVTTAILQATTARLKTTQSSD